jgi:hypothetical protein
MGLLSLIYLLFQGRNRARQTADHTASGMAHVKIVDDFFVADSPQLKLSPVRSRRSRKIPGSDFRSPEK